VADQAFRCVVWGSNQYWPDDQGDKPEGSHNPPHLIHRGQVTLPLVDGRKSADFSLADNTPGLPKILAVFPTLIWEIAYTQTSQELAAICARWIACSLGRVLLVIGIDIVEKKLKKTRTDKRDKKRSEKKSEKQPEKENSEDSQKVLKHVDCFLWELIHSEELADVPEGETLNKLVRCDEHSDDPKHPVGTRYYCISGLLEGGKTGPPFIKYVAGLVQSFRVSLTI